MFEQVEAIDTPQLTLLGAGEPREVSGAFVSDGMFDMLGFKVAIGRGVPARREPARRGPGRGAQSRVLAARVRRRSRACSAAPITSGGIAYTIVGVTAPESSLPEPADAVSSRSQYDDTYDADHRAGRGDRVPRRCSAAPGPASTRRGDRRGPEAHRRAAADRVQADSNDGLTFASTPLRELIVGDVQRPLLVLLGAVGFVLLVACANVANLLLARGSARHGELSVRAALGAGRARLIRQLVTESILLGLIGGALGLALAYWSTQALIAARPADLPRIDEIRLDGTVVLFTLGAALVTSLVFGLVPALQATNEHLLRGLAGKRPQRRRRTPHASPARGAGGRRNGARGGPAHRRRPADSQLPRADAGRSGIPARRRDGAARHASRAPSIRTAIRCGRASIS